MTRTARWQPPAGCERALQGVVATRQDAGIRSTDPAVEPRGPGKGLAAGRPTLERLVAAYVTAETAAVFRAVGSIRAQEHHLRGHRIALWQHYPDVPDAALSVMVRHELEHAARWRRSGTAFFEADEELRALVRGDHAAYAVLPSEREANAASAAYARRVLADAEVEAILVVEDYADLVAGVAAPADVVEETLAELAGNDAWRPGWSRGEKDADIRRARDSAAEWAVGNAADLDAQRNEPLIEVVAPVQEVHAEPR